MSEAGGHEKLGLTLLVQLFGRDVLDRLAKDGFDSAAAIAAAGPDRLATTTGIPRPLAERIAAVARETSESPAEPRKEHARPGARPRRSAVPKARAEAPERPRTLDAAEEEDAIVDDVALVSWMGFSSMAHSGRRTFSVSDSILDPARPATPPVIGGTPSGSETTMRAETPKPTPARPAMTLSGSFWSFGRPAGASVRRPERASEAPAPTDQPRRRDRHDR